MELSSFINIDIAIIFVFLSINLGVGFYYGRGVKTIEDYALGGRNFSTTALVSTIVATAVTGSLFTVGIARTYSDGLYDLIPTCGLALSLMITAYFFVPRMASFMGSLSLAESMGKYYGDKARIITAICAIIANVGFIAVQYKVFGGMVSYFLDISLSTTIIISGIVVTLYSAFGGIRAVTFTDMMQFMVFGVVIPLIGIIIWKSTFNIENFSLNPVFQDPKFDLKQVLDYTDIAFWEMTFLLFYFVMPMDPVYFQRVIMGRNIKQVKTAFSMASVILLVIIIAVAWIGFLIFSMKTDLDPNQLISFIINNYTYAGFKGLIIVSVMAMAMSSADSVINVSSVLFAHDICKPLNIFARYELKLTRIFAILFGMGSIILALNGDDLMEIILFANAFYIPIVTMPLLLTIWGLRTTKMSIFNGMGAGFLTVVIWKILDIELDPIIPAMLANLVVMLGTHYLFKQEGEWIDTREKIIEIKAENNFELVKKKSPSFMDVIKRHSARDEATYSFFGIFCFISTLSTIYLTHDDLLRGKHSETLMYIYEIMLVTSCMFMLFMMWSPRLKHPVVVGIAWNFALFYMMAFTSSFFLLLSNYDNVQLTVFTLNVMILFHLCRWQIAFFIITVGFACGYYAYGRIMTAPIYIGINHNTVIYVALLTITSMVTLVRRKQEEDELNIVKMDGLAGEVGTLSNQITDLNETVTHYSSRVQDQQNEIERLGATAQKILNNVNHELRLPVGNVMNFAEMISEGLEKFNKQQLKSLSDEVYKNSNRLSTMILNMLDLATLDAKKIELKKRHLNISELVENRVQICSKIYVEDKKITFEIKSEPNIMVYVDPDYMRQIIDNLVINAIMYSHSGVIRVEITRMPDDIVEITIKDQGMGIPRDELYDIFTPFKMGTKTESKAQGRGVGLALCKAAIEAHEGNIFVESDGINGALFRIWLTYIPELPGATPKEV